MLELIQKYSYSEEHYQEDFIVSVLHVSNFLDIPDGKAWAIRELPQLATFNPILRLELARKYRIDDWVEPAFHSLMTLPLHNIEVEEAARIGLPFYNILVRTKLKIENHRRDMAFVPPPAENDIDRCDTPCHCCLSWSKEWWNGVGRQLLHPDTPMTGRQVFEGLDNVRIPGMCGPCQEKTFEKVKQMSEAFFMEEGFVSEALAEMMCWQTDEPIRASMRVAGVLEESRSKNAAP